LGSHSKLALGNRTLPRPKQHELSQQDWWEPGNMTLYRRTVSVWSGSIGAVRVAGCLLGLALAATAAQAGALKVGDAAPDYLGRDGSGKQVHLSDYRGKLVIVTFWASWCTPCRKELPVLATIQKEATHDRLQVFAVNWQENRDQFLQIKRAL